MRARIIGLSELSPRDFRDWRELAERAIEPNPFYEPGFVLPAARWIAGDHVGLLIAEDANGWAACLPVRRGWRWGKLPLRSIAGWRHLYSYLGTPLVRGERPLRALEALIGRADEDRSSVALVFDWLGQGGPVGSALADVLDGRPGNAVTCDAFDRPVLRRRAEPTYLEEALSARRRKELRRLERRLVEQLGAPLRIVDRCDETAARDDFVRLEAAGWKGRAGTAIASSDSHRRFFEETCAAFADAGRLQLLALEGGGRTVAMQWNLLAADAIFCLKVAYDEDLASCSPGAQLEVRAVEAFHHRIEVNWIDSCTTPDNELINRLWPDRRRIASVVVARASLVGRSALAGVRSAASLRDRRRRRAALRGVASRLPRRVD
jgi:hypothetical protein